MICDGIGWADATDLNLFLFGGLRLAGLWFWRIDQIAMAHNVDVTQADHLLLPYRYCFSKKLNIHLRYIIIK